jgi:hypothetical protein
MRWSGDLLSGHNVRYDSLFLAAPNFNSWHFHFLHLPRKPTNRPAAPHCSDLYTQRYTDMECSPNTSIVQVLERFEQAGISLVEWETPLLCRLGYPLTLKPVCSESEASFQLE